MLYIVVALKPEAQAFVEKYKLSKSKLGNFTLFWNASIKLIISGIGVSNAAKATQTLINHYDMSDADAFLNIGICGANKNYAIGELLEIGTLIYNTKEIKLQSSSQNTLTCIDFEACEDTYDIVDMESFGFYDALIHSPAIKKYHILKVVSDHFEPENITKENTKLLLFNTLDAINKILKSKALS